MNTPISGAPTARDTNMTWPRIAVFGAGAVGCYFGARLAMAGAPVTLINRPAHVQAIDARGLVFESGGRRQPVAIAARTDVDAVADADLVLFCVKSRDTESGARTIAPLLRPDATVVSLQNGVDNARRMRAAGGIDALAAVVYVACSMPEPGVLRHAGRGDLLIGEVGAPPEETVRAAENPDADVRFDEPAPDKLRGQAAVDAESAASAAAKRGAWPRAADQGDDKQGDDEQ